MNIDTFIAEFRAENATYDSAGVIDELSIYKWVNAALKIFGNNIMVLKDTVISVKNSEGVLPEEFYSLFLAYKCDRKGYYVKNGGEDVLQNSFMWTERTENTKVWNSCEPCCKEETEKVITERLYFKDKEVDFYYNNPILLKLGKTFLKNKCHTKCRNRYVRDCPYEIVIHNLMLKTNFREGNVYMQYYGNQTDENGKIIIPDVGTGELLKYVEYYVYVEFFAKLMRNKEDKNIQGLFNYYVTERNQQRYVAETDVKFDKFSPSAANRIKKLNRQEILMYECNF